MLAGALVVTASPAFAMTPQATTPQRVIPGWSPLNAPADLTAFAARLDAVTYAVSCAGVTATGWSADVADFSTLDVRAVLVTTSAVAERCWAAPGDVDVRQGDTRLTARPGIADPTSSLGTLVSGQDIPYIDWDYVPTPRVGQWVGIFGRAAGGSTLPMLTTSVATVGVDTFTLNDTVGAAYVGAPVVDNAGRVLGVMTSAGTVVTGTPQFCAKIFICTDATKVWWDITAPTSVRDVKVVAGKGRITVTWKPVASDGGAPVAYWYNVNYGAWQKPNGSKVTVKARKGTLVTVGLSTINEAGPGPTVIVTGRAK